MKNYRVHFSFYSEENGNFDETVHHVVIGGFARLSGGTILPVLVVLVTVAASVMALAKGENNMSVVDQVKCVLRFSREQRKYPYHYTDEWSD